MNDTDQEFFNEVEAPKRAAPIPRAPLPLVQPVKTRPVADIPPFDWNKGCQDICWQTMSVSAKPVPQSPVWCCPDTFPPWWSR